MRQKLIILLIILCQFIMTSCATRYGGNGKLDIEDSESTANYSALEPKYSLYKDGSINQLFRIKSNLSKAKIGINNILLENNVSARESSVGQRYLIKTNYINITDSGNPNRVRQASLLFEIIPEKNYKCTEITINAVVRSKGNREDNWFKDDMDFEQFKEKFKYIYQFMSRNRCDE